MDELPQDDRRETARFRTDVAATVKAYRLPLTDARIVDVSAGGAMIAIDVELTRGDEIAVLAMGLEMVSTVAWITPGFCGLSFHRRLQLGEVSLLMRTKRRRALVANG